MGTWHFLLPPKFLLPANFPVTRNSLESLHCVFIGVEKAEVLFCGVLFVCCGLLVPFLAPVSPVRLYASGCGLLEVLCCCFFSSLRGGRKRFVAIGSKSFDFAIVGIKEDCLLNYRAWEGEEVHTCSVGTSGVVVIKSME